MPASEARLAANRKNALKSTGPRTAAGKERSRANALKHGLCSTVVVAEDIELVQARSSEWYYALKPQNKFQSWMVDEIAVVSLRIDRSERMERRLRDRHSLRAGIGWDDDRRSEAEALGRRIGRSPSEVVDALRRTPQGCDWLTGRWELLARSAETRGPWTPDQARLASDLLGTPPEFRDGRPIAPASDQAEEARREIAALKKRRASAADLDEVDRALVEADLLDESNLELRRLRRYESALHGRLRWCMAQFHYKSPHFQPHPDLKPRWAIDPESKPEPEAKPEPAPAPAPAPAPSAGRKTVEVWRIVPPNPPFDLEPHEYPAPGLDADIPKILADRRAAKARRAEQRRESRRRKLERIRA